MLRRTGAAWVQLTYTSADSVTGGRGGWGVKETSAAASERVLAILRQHVTTRIVEVEETSEFASDAQLAARPRRLMSREIDGYTCLWHAVSAGRDATGRPGNVFTHAAAIAEPERLLRPIEYWRSAGWLTPFGPLDVNAARLGPLEPGMVVTREAVLAFIDPFERNLSLEWLLSGFAHALSTGGAVVLAVGSPDDAAMWLGAVSYLTNGLNARRFSWVTFERAADITDLRQQGVRVICVPREDLAEVAIGADPSLLVLDPSWVVDESQPQAGWWTVHGQRFPVHPWQTAMTDLLALDPGPRLGVLARMDEIDAELADVAVGRMPVHLPLAIALLEEPRALTGMRTDRLVDCLRAASEGGLWSRRVFWSLIPSDISDADWSQLNTLPGFETLVSAHGDAELAVAYLSTGWRDQPRPVLEWSSMAYAIIRETAHGVLSVALGDAVSALDGSRDEVVAAARLVGFVADVWGDPVAAAQSELVRVRLADLAMTADELAGVPTDIWPAHTTSPAAAPGLFSPSNEPTDAPSSTTAPVVVAPAVLAASAPLPPVGIGLRHPGAVAPADIPIPLSTPFSGSASRLPESFVSALVQLYDDALLSGDRPRQDAYADCLMVYVGLRTIPLQTVTESVHEELSAALDALEDPDRARFPPRVRGLVWGWVATYFALCDLASVQLPGPAWELEMATAYPDETTEGLARLLRRASREALVTFIRFSVIRVTHNGVFLDHPVGPDATPIGLRALRQVKSELPPGLLAGALAEARSALLANGFQQSVSMLADLDPAPTHEPTPTGRNRKGRTS